jgi:hypothetical protein
MWPGLSNQQKQTNKQTKNNKTNKHKAKKQRPNKRGQVLTGLE